eukprot:GEMP01042606.1.p3 GENE.GEMP01042606.1~~GEMP01042606.1.p3  ORF type:complete len:216 (+),score=48.09 GEMP01042606.1:60-707(+)
MGLWDWWLKKCTDHQNMFLFLSGTVLLVQPPKMWALSLRLQEERDHRRDLMEFCQSFNDTPISRYLFESLMRGLDVDVLKHALLAALMSSSVASVVPLSDYRTQFITFTRPFWDSWSDILLPHIGEQATSIVVGITHQTFLVRLSPVVNSVCACLGGATCINYVLTKSTEQGWFVYTLALCGLTHQWYPAVQRWYAGARKRWWTGTLRGDEEGAR